MRHQLQTLTLQQPHRDGPNQAVMEPPQDFKSLQDGIQKSLVSSVKTVNRIAAEDLSFQRTVNPDAAEQLDDKSARLLDLSTRLLQSAARACGLASPKLEDAEDIDMKWQAIVDVVDTVLEKADTALDEYTGLVKRKEPSNAESVCRGVFIHVTCSPILICAGTQLQAPEIYGESHSKR